MIIGWLAPARVRHRRHAQLIKGSAETFYNKHNNNLFSRWESFSLIKKRNKYGLVTTKPHWLLYTHFSHPLKIFLAEPGVIKPIAECLFCDPVSVILIGP